MCKNLNYESRCKFLDLQLLSDRRLRGDLIQKYKINNRLDIIEWQTPPVCMPPRAGNRGQLRREIVRCCNQRQYFFNNRIVNAWNDLPDVVFNSKSINIFKNNLDKYMNNKNSVILP